MKKIWKYPDEVKAFVREHGHEGSIEEMRQRVNERFGLSLSYTAMRSFFSNHKIHSAPRKGRKYTGLSRYPTDMEDFIRSIAKGKSSQELTDAVNEKYGEGTITVPHMKAYKKNHGIITGLTGRFEKGHSPSNKGMTLEEICKGDPEKLARIRSTQFKKGHKPPNEMQIGDVTVVGGYKIRKKAMTGKQWDRWEFLHRAIWEEHNGPIPEGMIVTFKDSDRMNCDISNLMLITKAQNAVMTAKGYRSGDPDITEVGAALAALEITVKQKKKRKRRKT